MNRARVFAIVSILFMFAVGSLSAFGRREAAEIGPLVSSSYVISVTALDVSALPVSRQLMGDTVTRSLANALENVSFRFRGEEESIYYRDFAWENSRAVAARALESRRYERDMLLFRGEPRWRYRKSLKTIDEAILKLEEELAIVDALAPTVESRPVFSLSETNRNGTFPPPPKEGEEVRFCINQRADAFLVGSLSEFHGRVYLDLKVYTLHTRSFSYEDSVLFSSGDLLSAMDEISVRLVAAASGALPSGIIVQASPPESMVIIDGEFVGWGDMDLHLRTPGMVELELRAENHSPFSYSLELNPGELAKLQVELTPFGLSVFEATVHGSPGSLVYHGGLFLGETPLTLRLPRSQFAYLSVETPEGNIGTAIYRNNDIVRGDARFVRNVETPDGMPIAAFNTRVPVNPEEKRVDRARRGFYGAYGALWFILPAALITGGVARTYIDANNYVAVTNMYADDMETRLKIYDNAVRGRNVRIGSTVAWTATLGVTFFQIFRYLYVSGADATPIVVHVPLAPPELPAENFEEEYFYEEEPFYEEEVYE